MILDGQILLILKYPLTVVKPMVDKPMIDVCKFNICLESLTKLSSKCYISSVESK